MTTGECSHTNRLLYLPIVTGTPTLSTYGLCIAKLLPLSSNMARKSTFDFASEGNIHDSLFVRIFIQDFPMKTQVAMLDLMTTIPGRTGQHFGHLASFYMRNLRTQNGSFRKSHRTIWDKTFVVKLSM